MIKVRVTGVESLTKQLNAYKNGLKEKMHTLLERLAALGIDVAEQQYNAATYAGDFDVTVQKEPQWVDETHLFVTATGSTILFIEFGAGVTHTEHPQGAQFGYVHGTYGKGNGKRKAWGYYGEPGQKAPADTKVVTGKDGQTVTITSGNEPARAMYDASKEMRQQILTIAREVFGSGRH